ncbi:MAG: tail fiber domain-containing protein, partial [Chitinophagales bacterium]
TNATGNLSTAMGNYTTAPSFSETVIGRYNTNYTPGNTSGWSTTDRLFVVGNGTNSTSRSDAMVILKNGNVGIGNSDPEGQLFVEQSNTVATGTGGIFVDWQGDHWKTYHSGLHYSFSNEGTRYAYVEDNTGNYVIPSDKNLKTNIAALPSVMEGVLRLNPVSYVYKSSSDPSANTLGFLAQEVGEVFPDVVRYSEDGTPGLAYDLFSIISIKAIQEQQEIIESLKTELKEVKALLEQNGIK